MNIKNLSIERINSQSNKWNELLKLFEDANIYQTGAFGINSKGGSKLENVVIKNNNTVISIAQVRIKTLPFLNRGVAYVRWGPLWRKSGETQDLNNFRMAVSKLYGEYVLNKKLVLQIMPNIVSDGDKTLPILNESGFLKSGNDFPYYSIFVDISKPLEEIRKSFRKKWRYSLKQAEKNNLEVKSGTDLALFEQFYSIYKEMHGRKKFKETVNVDSFKDIQELLPPDQKMQIFICEKDGNPVSALVGSALGNTGIYLLGGTTQTGLKLSASYLVQWETIKWLKSKNIKWYDLGGIDPEGNKGVYIFKKGLGGNEIKFIGKFEAYKSFLSKTVVKLGEKLSS